MKKYLFLSAAICVAMSMVSCKSSESKYKEAYLRAQQNQTITQAPVQTTTAETQPVGVQPVQPVQTVTTTPVSNENLRSENLTLVNGAGIKAFSVVVGAFSVQTNAEARQRELQNAGYSAQLARNPQGLYRVIASTFDDLDSAIQSRNVLRAKYPDAWLLRK